MFKSDMTPPTACSTTGNTFLNVTLLETHHILKLRVKKLKVFLGNYPLPCHRPLQHPWLGNVACNMLYIKTTVSVYAFGGILMCLIDEPKL